MEGKSVSSLFPTITSPAFQKEDYYYQEKENSHSVAMTELKDYARLEKVGEGKFTNIESCKFMC